MAVKAVDILHREKAPGDTGLVGDHDQEKPCFLELLERLRDTGNKLERLRVDKIVFVDVDGPVAIKKNGRPKIVKVHRWPFENASVGKRMPAKGEKMEKLSAFITTLNNARTLPICLESVKWADEIIVLDSYSSDETLQIAEGYGAQIFQQKFLGYGPQKQSAMEKTSHRWALLLDADEALSPELQEEIQKLLKRGPACDGYELLRQEQMFWQMASTRSRLNGFLRLFDKTRAYISDMPIHAAPKVDGKIGRLNAPFYHFGEIDIHTKVDKINHYSTGLVADKIAKGKKASPWTMIFYPPLFFLRIYFLKRNFLNGWAGFIASATMAFYAFLKYAKVFEFYQKRKHGAGLLPDCAPGQEE